jgi:hypothetical protein
MLAQNLAESSQVSLSLIRLGCRMALTLPKKGLETWKHL